MPIVVRLFEPISLLFPEGALMPHSTVAAPNCILCSGKASPPSRMGFVATGNRQGIFSICGSCSDCSDDELERKIVATVDRSPPPPRRPSPEEFVPLPWFPWETRPETYPLDDDEVATALYLANGDLKEAAALLKVTEKALRKPIRQTPRLQHLLERMRAPA
jgi:hypothetical protein